MFKPVHWIAGSFFVVLLGGCASIQSPNDDVTEAALPDSAESSTIPPALEETHFSDFDPEVLYGLLTAEIAAQRGRYDVTLQNYVAAAKQSSDPGVIERAMRIAQTLKADNAQRQVADAWLAVEPDSLEAHRISAVQAVKAGNLQQALAHMEAIMELGGDADFDNLAALSANLDQADQRQLLELYQHLRERHPDNDEIQFSIALLHRGLNEPMEGLAVLEPLLDRSPDYQPAMVLRGDLLYNTGQREEALEWLDSKSREYPDNRRLGTLYARTLLSEERLDESEKEFFRLMNRFPDVPGLKLSYALVALENNHLRKAEIYLKELIEAGHHENEAFYYLGQLAERRNQPTEAIGDYRQVEEGAHRTPALARIAEIIATTQGIEAARNELSQMRNSNPEEEGRLWLLELNLLQERGQLQEAAEVADKALASQPDDNRLRYARAMLLDQLGEPTAAETDLRQIIEEEPDNSVALNALGYILTVQTDRLDEAEALIDKALALDPQNPAILDSKGWVKFRLGDIAAARDYLSQAYQSFPDPEVAAHYGEVLWITGSQDQAREVWKSALDENPDHPLLIETVNRFGATELLP